MKNIFQVEFYGKINDNSFWVDGRFIEGNIIEIGDKFSFINYEGNEEKVSYIVSEILMYNKSIPLIDLGMTGRLILNGNLQIAPKKSFELISKD